jgi:hypothetical protein
MLVCTKVNIPKSEKPIEEAETAVRVVPDSETSQFVAIDVAAIARLLNQAHVCMLGSSPAH